MACKLIKVGAPTGNIWFTIETSSGGVPTGTAIAASAKIDVSRLSTSATVIHIPFYKELGGFLSTSTQYHLVAQGDWTVSGTNYVGWRMDGSAGAYADGSKALYDSDTLTWTSDTDDDMYFTVYVERDLSNVIMPTGYTRKCHIGYVRNDASSHFAPFFQDDRTWQHRDISVTDHVQLLSSVAAGLNSVLIAGTLTACPSRNQIRLTLGATGTGAAPATIAIGDYTATDLASATGVGAQAVLRAELNAAVPHVFGSVNILYGIVSIEGTTSGGVRIVAFEW
jgi:hypothetical protein